MPSRSWNAADYGAGVDVGETVGNAVGVAEGVSVASGDSEGAGVARLCGDDAGDDLDALARRKLESPVSDTRRTNVPIAAAMPPTFAQNSVFRPSHMDSPCRPAARLYSIISVSLSKHLSQRSSVE